MSDTLSTIRRLVEKLQLDAAILFLNHLLATSRGEGGDSALQKFISQSKNPVPAFVIHFLAKEIILRASNLGTRNLDWPQFERLCDLVINLDDPICHDPDWKDRDPSGAFLRIFSQQFPSQDRRMLQKFGLALGLFRDLGPIRFPTTFDIRAELESELGTSITSFMSLGFLCLALRRAKYGVLPCSGTFTPMDLANAFSLGFTQCIPENWNPFFQRTTCTVQQFRETCAQVELPDVPQFYTQFQHNPLMRFPILDIGGQRYVSVDPELIIERVTHGLYYDLFAKDRVRFTERFGYVFDAFVAKLIGSVIPQHQHWSEATLHQSLGSRWQPPSKNADQAVLSESTTVLIESKNLKPSLALTTCASEDSMNSLVGRLTEAVQKLSEHSQSINKGEWSQFGLKPSACVGAIITYGQTYAVNGPFIRSAIKDRLAQIGLIPIPWVVLSLDDLDAVISLVDRQYAFEDVVGNLVTAEDSFNPLSHFYKDELVADATSNFAKESARQFFDGVTPK